MVSRLAIAKEFAGELRAKEGRNLVAVGVYGSVAMGTAREFSDLDLLVVVHRKRPYIRIQLRKHVLVTILQLTPDEAREEVFANRSDLAEVLGGWRSMRSLYDPTRLLARLRRHAERPGPEQFREAAHFALLETCEDYGKLLNAIDAGDRDEMREMAIWFTGAAHTVVFDLAQEVVPTGRRAFVELRKHGALGRDIRSLRYGRHTSIETLQLAIRIWNGLLARARREGIPVDRLSRGRSSD
jgi:predicted nucleotidyltransferase